MQIPHLKIPLILLFLIGIITPWSSSMGAEDCLLQVEEARKNCLSQIDNTVEQRWNQTGKRKKSYAPYAKKSRKAIRKEFKVLKNYRTKWTDFNYTQLPNSEANTILIHGHHFIALHEPTPESLPSFFDLLVNNKVSVLVRTNPESEYFNHYKTTYWQDRIVKDHHQRSFIQPTGLQNPPAIPYVYTDKWNDGKALDIPELHRLVQDARGAYAKSKKKGPIAVHCRAGRGRTGTFMAAYVIANMLDVMKPNEISIEEIVLRLSIQRQNQVATARQYASLYGFAKYYLAQKNKVIKKVQSKKAKKLKLKNPKQEKPKKGKILV